MSNKNVEILADFETDCKIRPRAKQGILVNLSPCDEACQKTVAALGFSVSLTAGPDHDGGFEAVVIALAGTPLTAAAPPAPGAGPHRKHARKGDGIERGCLPATALRFTIDRRSTLPRRDETKGEARMPEGLLFMAFDRSAAGAVKFHRRHGMTMCRGAPPYHDPMP